MTNFKQKPSNKLTNNMPLNSKEELSFAKGHALLLKPTEVVKGNQKKANDKKLNSYRQSSYRR